MHFHKNFIKRTFFVSSRKLISFLLFVAEWHKGTDIKFDSFIENKFEKDIKVFKLIMRRIHVGKFFKTQVNFSGHVVNISTYLIVIHVQFQIPCHDMVMPRFISSNPAGPVIFVVVAAWHGLFKTYQNFVSYNLHLLQQVNLFQNQFDIFKRLFDIP